MPNLLVIDTEDHNWYKIFENEAINGSDIVVEQAQWKDLEVTSYSDSGPYIDLFPADNPIENTKQYQKRVFKPDFLLVRNVVKGPLPGQNYSSKLFGLLHEGLPAVNSLKSIYMCLERPVVYGELKKVEKKLGDKSFKLIDQTFYSHFRTAIITPSYPNVIKVGHSHSGLGKMKLQNSDQFEDLISIIALQDTYFSAEPFIESSYELRLQKIGSFYRAFKRSSFDWKINRTTPMIEDVELEPKYKLWLDECSKIFGGLDLFALDVLVTPDGKEILLELNDTGAGMNYKPQEDNIHVKDVVIDKMTKLLKNK